MVFRSARIYAFAREDEHVFIVHLFQRNKFIDRLKNCGKSFNGK